MTSAARYEVDVVAWSAEQARFLREGRLELLDTAHPAGEIEDVGKSEQRELANRMAVLLAHLLKWQRLPVRRGGSWQLTIRNQRRGIARRGGDPETNLRAKARWLKLVDQIAKEEGVDPAKLYNVQIPGQTPTPNKAATGTTAPESGGAKQEDKP